MRDTIREFIVENFLFGDETDMITDDESFMETGMIDSTGILEIIFFLEETYEITIEDNELIPENLDSLSNIIKFVTLKLAA